MYMTFVDFETAFDSVHQDSLWKILRTYGIPDKIIKMIQLLYDDNECTVADGGLQSEWFRIKTGVKQGCCMSGFLFLLAVDHAYSISRNTTGHSMAYDDEAGRPRLCRRHRLAVIVTRPHATEDDKTLRNSKENWPKHQQEED